MASLWHDWSVSHAVACEATHPGHLRQPINVAASLCTVLVGAWLVLHCCLFKVPNLIHPNLVTTTHALLVALSTLSIGISSCFYHASLSHTAEYCLVFCWASLAAGTIRFGYRCVYGRASSRYEQLLYSPTQQLRVFFEHTVALATLSGIWHCSGSHWALPWVLFGVLFKLGWQDGAVIAQPRNRRVLLVLIACVALVWQLVVGWDLEWCDPDALLQRRALAHLLEALGCGMTYAWVLQYHQRSNKYARTQGDSKVCVNRNH